MSAIAERSKPSDHMPVLPEFTPPLERAIINRLQYGLPLTRTPPYKDVADELGVSEVTLLKHLQALLDNGTLTRFGPPCFMLAKWAAA